MDQQPNKPSAPSPEEIARLEAEAVRAMRQGEEQPAPTAAPETESQKPDWSDVPYVDDAPREPAAPKADDDGNDDADYVPTEMEKRVAAIPEDKWNLYTALGGAALGVLSIAILTLGSEDLGSWALALAAVIALLAPRYLERWWRRPMPRARVAMLIAMLVSLAAVFVIGGMRTGFRFFESK